MFKRSIKDGIFVLKESGDKKLVNGNKVKDIIIGFKRKIEVVFVRNGKWVFRVLSKLELNLSGIVKKN